jgi:peptidoglycan/LPS O-acetylase OafA/YrhL
MRSSSGDRNERDKGPPPQSRGELVLGTREGSGATANGVCEGPDGKLGYSPSIDGLRALAVISVIVNHIDPRFQPGGYLGVDIFFVISGFVITQSLIARDQAGPATLLSQLLDFYVRRVKRLLPALLVCVTFTAILYCFFVSGTDLSMRKSLATGAASVFGLSNIYLVFNSVDYFGVDANQNPFLHTWSLGVEEQFYLIFPVLLLLMLRRGKGTALWGCILVAMLSLATFVVLMARSPALAYFILPTRMFELLLGAIAFLCRDKEAVRALRAPNLLLIAVVALTFVPETWIAWAVPAITILTALLILALVESGKPSLLATPALVAAGLRSYSIYIWHWPVLFFVRYMAGISIASAALVFGITALVSLLSYAYIEKPFRSGAWASTRLRTLAAGFSTSAAVVAFLAMLAFPLRGVLYLGVPPALAGVGVDSLQHPLRIGDRVVWSGDKCAISPGNLIDIDPDDCTLGAQGEAGRTVLVLGNSYSAAELHLFAEAARMTGLSFVVTTAWGASPVGTFRAWGQWPRENDHYWTKVVPRLVSALKPGDVVLLASDLAVFAPATPTDDSAARLAELKRGLETLAAEMKGRGLTVGIQRALPFLREARCSPDAGAGQWFILGDGDCRFYSRESTLARRKALDSAIDDVTARHTNVFSIDLFEVFCPGPRCTYRSPDGVMMYRDVFSHPSVEASQRAADTFVRQLSDGLAPREARR